MLQRLGCLAYVGVPKQGRDKMANRAQRGYLIGYGHPTGQKAWQIWIPSTDKIIMSRDVEFYEDQGLLNSEKCPPDDLDLLDDDDTPISPTATVDEEYFVESIRDQRTNSAGEIQYLVKWKGYCTPT